MSLFHKRVRYAFLGVQDEGFVFETPTKGIVHIESFTRPSMVRNREGKLQRLVVLEHGVSQVQIDGVWTTYHHNVEDCVICGFRETHG